VIVAAELAASAAGHVPGRLPQALGRGGRIGIGGDSA